MKEFLFTILAFHPQSLSLPSMLASLIALFIFRLQHR
jgi:hypothetical protein